MGVLGGGEGRGNSEEGVGEARHCSGARDAMIRKEEKVLAAPLKGNLRSSSLPRLLQQWHNCLQNASQLLFSQHPPDFRSMVSA